MCGSGEAAEDLAQETFLAAAESLESFQRRSSAYTWLYGILLNKFRRWMRRKSRRPVSLQGMVGSAADARAEELFAADVPGPGEVAESREMVGLVLDVVEELPADHRAVITLRFIEEMSYRDISEILNCPMGTVKSRIHYALEKIGEQLEAVGMEPERRSS
jgi:RNA polymerase sigma-70 factor (ECF subfamily)